MFITRIMKFVRAHTKKIIPVRYCGSRAMITEYRITVINPFFFYFTVTTNSLGKHGFHVNVLPGDV